MNTYFLKLNKTKTKILVLAPPNVMSSIEIHGTFMDNKTIRFVSSAKNLGVWLDENLDFKTHICKVVSSCFMVLREIWKVKTFLPKECLCTIVCSLVLSKLDYCNTLYYNINNSEHNLLQAVQNVAIRLIGGRFKYDRVSISPLFEQLHWLRIEERIVFKVCLIVHKCVWELVPEALKAMVEMSNLRALNLVEKKFRSAYGKRAFSCAGPTLWTNLPLHIRLEDNINKFKKLLKSFLMNDSYDFYRRVKMR